LNQSISISKDLETTLSKIPYINLLKDRSDVIEYISKYNYVKELGIPSTLKQQQRDQILNTVQIPSTNLNGNTLYESIKSVIQNFAPNLVKEITYKKLKELNQTRNPKIKFTEKEILGTDAAKQLYQLNPIVGLLKNSKSFPNEIDSIYNSGMQYLEDLAKMLALEKIQLFDKANERFETENYKTYERFNSLIRQLLAKDFIYDVDVSSVGINEQENNIGGIKGTWTLNGRKFNYTDLSDGEKVLFSFAFLLFIQELNTKIPIQESLIIIDEPETHLHPELQVLLIKRLKSIIKNSGQPLIATHSIHIISILEPEEIYLVENNKLNNPSSKNISKMIDTLMGFGEDYEKFRDFCFQEYDWGFRHFIAQCLSEPEIINSAKKDDPQIKLFKDAISTRSNINILDFGAGKGRLGKELSEEIRKKAIEYNTYDITNKFNTEIKAVGTKNIYNDINDLPKSNFHFVVMCNVLHEIDLLKIVPELNKVCNSITEDGFLIIIEDKILSKGENPKEEGFLLFAEKELKYLLNTSIGISLLKSNEIKYKERIMCAIISKTNIGTINDQSLTLALEELKSNSFRNYKLIKAEDSKKFKSLSEQGRISALFALNKLEVRDK
jgi:energy-coupling factor transporter ATP-binding protein EcfA2